MKRNVIIFVIALPFLISFAFLIATKRPASTMDLPLPNPNGYDQFVAAGGMLQGQTGLYDTMDETNLAALVATNAESLVLAQSALTNECRVPVKYSPSYDVSKDLVALRTLCQVMTAKGRLAELEGRPMEAVKDYLDVIHFGNEAARGGRLVEGMIGTAIESMGDSGLQRIVSNLDAKSSRETAASLETLDSQRQTWDDILDQENYWVRRSFGIRGELLKVYLDFKIYLGLASDPGGRKNGKQIFNKNVKSTRQLLIDLAARAYELDKGKPATSINDLVPTYLKAIPQDPTTGKDMVYPP